MQLSKQTIDCLLKVINVAKILKIETIIFDQYGARGQLQLEGLFLFFKDNVPAFEFQTLGLTRVATLITRMNLLGNELSIDAEEIEKVPGEKAVLKLILANNKTMIDFKCADPALLPKIPKNIADPVFYTFNVSNESIQLLGKVKTAINKADVLTFVGNKGAVLCKASDDDGDMFNHVITEELVLAPECDKPKFAFSYKNNVIVPLFKEACQGEDSITVNITRRGLLTFNVHGITVFITQEI